MKSVRAYFCAGLLLFVCSPTMVGQQSPLTATSAAVVPQVVNFSGVLTDLNGKPLTNITGVTFLLYKEEHGGAPLWLETQNVQPDKTGHYSVMLGATTSTGLPADIFVAAEARWLAVQPQGQTEQPRVMLLSVPYALKAVDAQTIGGLPPSAFVLAAPLSSGTASAAAGSSAASPSSPPPPTTSNVTTTGGTASTIPMFTTATNIQNSILTQTGTTGINVSGALNLPAKGTAIASASFTSRPLDFVASVFNSTTSTPVAQTFQWQAEPVNNDKSTASGTLNLLYAMGTATPAETGLKISSKGLFTFAAGQTFPGTGSGTVTSVGLSAPASDFAVTGSPVTSTGTLKLAWNVAPTNANTPNAIVKRDSSGNFSAGSILATALASTGAITGGTASASIISAGSKLGVGTAAPAVPLDVFSSTAGIHAPLARFGSSAAQDANSILVYNGSGNTEVFTVGGLSSFMPGTAPGDGGLRVLPGKNIFFGDSGLSRLELTAGGTLRVGGPPTGGSGTAAASFGGFGDFAIDASGTAAGRFVVKESGLVGIGQAAPANQLDVYAQSTSVNAINAIGGSAASGSGQNGGIGLGVGGGNGDPAGNSNGGNAIEGFGGASAGTGSGGSGVFGLAGSSITGSPGSGVFGAGCFGIGLCGDGVVGESAPSSFGGSNGYAGNFAGDINVSGAVFAMTKDFKMDHPLDPANKYLFHASVESSEMMNIYTGNVVTDARGEATVKLPDWFDVLNTDFRYQLTAIGQPSPGLYIAREISGGSFQIAGGLPGTKVSWQVTGVRQDPYAKAHPLIVEQEKEPRLKGFYIQPELYGQPEEKQIERARHPQMMKQIKEVRARQLAALQKSAAQPVTAQPK
jgi:hypothetical protein